MDEELKAKVAEFEHQKEMTSKLHAECEGLKKEYLLTNDKMEYMGQKITGDMTIQTNDIFANLESFRDRLDHIEDLQTKINTNQFENQAHIRRNDLKIEDLQKISGDM